jgi:hypothetical protein
MRGGRFAKEGRRVGGVDGGLRIRDGMGESECHSKDAPHAGALRPPEMLSYDLGCDCERFA